MTAPWFVSVPPEHRTRLRLFCLPFAGGAASTYRTWMHHVPPGVSVVPVELPGRGTRIAEAPLLTLEPLVERLAQAMHAYLDMPFAIFGHSMGALLGYELAHRLWQMTGATPVHLLVSAHRAPHLPNPHANHHTLPDAALIQKVRALNGTPADILEQDDLIQMVLPVVRADFTACETYVHRPAPRLPCPITVFGGTHDPLVARWQLAAWNAHTHGPVQLQMLPGDHFYFQANQQAFFRLLREALAPYLTVPQPTEVCHG